MLSLRGKEEKSQKIQNNIQAHGQALASVSALLSLAKTNKIMETEQENEMEIMNEEEYTEVVRKKRKREYFEKIFEQNTTEQHKSPERDPAIRNRYEILQNHTTTATIENTEPVSTKPTQPPPIIIHQKIKDYSEFIKYIKSQVGNQFYVRHTGGRISLQLYDYSKYNKVKSELKDTIEFHTYTPKHEKTYGFIIRGLDQDPNPEEIKKDLEETHKLKVLEIFKMKTNYRPLFLVITNKEITLNFLKENIRFILNTKIYWEIHRNLKQTTQCKRCQEWGHSTTNCFSTPKCAHCANTHWTYSCQQKENVKCANCNSVEHKAYSKDCPKYKERINFIKKQEKQEYVDAPLPKQNAWNRTSPLEEVHDDNSRSNRTTVRIGQEQFPELTPPTRKPNVQRNTNTTINTNNMTDFQTLTNEFKKLNSLVNLEKMIKLISKLNLQLEQATSKIEQFLIINDFTSKLTDDDF